MLDRERLFFSIGMLAAIALSATVVALSLQLYFGRGAIVAGIRQGLAALGGLVFAVWFLGRSNGRR